MYSHTQLGNAIQQILEKSDKIVAYTGHGTYDSVNDQNLVRIGSYKSNVTGANGPSVGWQILDSEPLSKQPIVHWHKSMLRIYAVANEEVSAAILADLVAKFFTEPDTAEAVDAEANCLNWFRDLSNDCIFNRYTEYMGRRKFGQEGISVFEEEADTFREAVHVKVIWRDYNCSDEYCDPVTQNECSNEDTEYDDGCPDCE